MSVGAWAKLLGAGAALLDAVGRLVGVVRGDTEDAAPTESQRLNQRQEQSAGAARNYSSRRTERAAKSSGAGR